MKHFICIFCMLIFCVNQLFSKNETDSVCMRAMVVRNMNLWHIIDSIAKGNGCILRNNYCLYFQKVKQNIFMSVHHLFYNTEVVNLINGEESVYDNKTRVLGYVVYNGTFFFILSDKVKSKYIYKMIQPISDHSVFYKDKEVYQKGVIDVHTKKIGFSCKDGTFTPIP